METVVEHESQTTLSQLLARVARGERVTITEHGVPVAVLAPPEVEQKREIRQAIEDIKQLSKGRVLGPDLTIKDMIEEGRD